MDSAGKLINESKEHLERTLVMKVEMMGRDF